MIIVVSGPGGVGKGTIVDRLVSRDSGLWLSRSWTTRDQRPGEPADAYVFATSEAFERRITDGGFIEWTEFLGNYYGTPVPDLDDVDGRDVVLEIELDGAQQVKERFPDSVLIFLLPPTREEQERRLRGRGDPNDKVLARLRKAEAEEPLGRRIADHVLVNDDLDRTVDDMLAVIEGERAVRSSG
ncbi:MAG: guanylate kinase [Actinomycetota bacterium]|nr:guanylate kinase [Actinomycetota bacterium]MDA3016138.1 guanylate kinase [Actinomycetota bacterium]MDA3029343.1 guanylate kinase [Actinomycetota bacterium]